MPANAAAVERTGKDAKDRQESVLLAPALRSLSA
jgi:hypothetical protein